jgi:hypothetical protein
MSGAESSAVRVDVAGGHSQGAAVPTGGWTRGSTRRVLVGSTGEGGELTSSGKPAYHTALEDGRVLVAVSDLRGAG